MWVGLIIVLALVLVGLCAIAGAALFVRFLTDDAEDDRAMRFDPFARPQPPSSLRLFDLIMLLRKRPKQLSYRRDRRGRFRKLDR